MLVGAAGISASSRVARGKPRGHWRPQSQGSRCLGPLRVALFVNARSSSSGQAALRAAGQAGVAGTASRATPGPGFQVRTRFCRGGKNPAGDLAAVRLNLIGHRDPRAAGGGCPPPPDRPGARRLRVDRMNSNAEGLFDGRTQTGGCSSSRMGALGSDGVSDRCWPTPQARHSRTSDRC